MSFFHGKSELTDTGHCFVSLPAEWDLSNRAHFCANQFNLTILRIIFLDDLKCDKYIYVSWNGARHRNRRRTDLVLFDRQFAGRQGITSGESILVQTVASAGDLKKLAQCSQLDIRPLTEDDYQLVTVNSGEIERVLLDQLRVVTTAFCRGENSEPRFNVLPIWLRSSANVPIFVEVVDWEPKSAQGLVLVDSTKLVIRAPGEKEEKVISPSSTSQNTLEKGEEEENSSNTSSGGHQLLQSVFGMIRSSVAPIATAGVKLIQGGSEPSPENSAAASKSAAAFQSIPLYGGQPLLLRVLPALKATTTTTALPPVCTAFISPHYFDHHHPDQLQYQIMSFKKVLTTAERQEKAKKGQTPLPKAVDTSTMAAEERYYTVLAERLLRAHHDQEEGVGNTTEQTTFGCLLLLVFPSQDVPPGSIALNEALRLQANIAATSYVHLSAVSDQRAIGQRVISSKDHHHSLLSVPVAPTLTLIPLNGNRISLESWTAELQRRLKEVVVVEAKPLEDDEGDHQNHPLNHYLFLGNSALLKLGDGLFFVHHSELPSPPSLTDPDRLNWARLLAGCFLVDPQHTKVVVKQVVLPLPQPADTLRELLKRCSRSIADLDSTHLRLLKLKNKRKPFGGYARQLERCTAFLRAALQLEEEKEKASNGSVALLVTGGKGAGKSALLGRLLLTLADQPVPPFIRKLKCGHLRGKRIESLQKALLGELQEAVQRQPSVLLLEDLDELAYQPEGTAEEKNPSFESSETPSSSSSANENVPLESVHVERVALVVLRLLQALHRLKKTAGTGGGFSRVAVIATAKSADSLHRLLVRGSTSVFDETVHLEPPDGRARRQIIECLLKDRDLSIPGAESGGGHQLKPTVQFSTGRLARATADYSPADISTLLEMALHRAVMACSDQDLQPQQQEQQPISLPVTEEHITAALAAYTPPHLLASRGDQHQQQTTGRMLQDVGGLSSAKEALLETVLLPSRYPALFAALPLKAASSALLYGAPGTGKTVLVEAIANEAAAITSSSSSKRPLSFISVKGPELLSKYIGASEAAVRSLFLRAQAAAPCILFFDEFDSLAPRRGHDSTGVTDRLVNQLLTLMDGLEERKRDVFILAATSRPDLIDLALLRPGRFDRCIPVGLPGEAERVEILLALSRKLTIDQKSVDFTEVAARTEHFTGADLQALLYTAYLGACKRRTKAFENEKLAIEEEEEEEEVIIRGEDVDGALAQTAPSLSATERAKFDAIYDRFVRELSGQFVPGDRQQQQRQQKVMTLA